MKQVVIRRTMSEDVKFAKLIWQEIRNSAIQRGTGIGERSLCLFEEKISQGYGIIALEGQSGRIAGFCYLSSWDQGKMVSHSALIVFPEFRGQGISRRIKQKAIGLGLELFPEADIFGLTTSLTVMKVNSDLGYKPVTYEQLTKDPDFWDQCRGCVNFDILDSKQRSNCLCTGMRLSKSQVEIRSEHIIRDHTRQPELRKGL